MANPGIDSGGASESAWFGGEPSDEFGGATVLLVEDDADIRELMSTLMQLAGFLPTACETAELALEQLREQHFDVVLTDYMLPARTGAWLLNQASQEGLIDGSTALVLTAHPNPPDVNGFEVVLKPCDLDELVSRIRRRLGGNSRPPRRTVSGNSRGGPGDGNGNNGSETIQLILYVRGESPNTADAIRNIKEAIARFSPGCFSLTICDLSRNPDHGTADGIAFTPALVQRSPGPRTFILGQITNADVVAELLAQAL